MALLQSTITTVLCKTDSDFAISLTDQSECMCLKYQLTRLPEYALIIQNTGLTQVITNSMLCYINSVAYT
jgi:hypothetical protein